MKENEQAVHVIYASNDGYAGHLAASLCSLLDNNRHIKNLDILFVKQQVMDIDMDIMIMIMIRY